MFEKFAFKTFDPFILGFTPISSFALGLQGGARLGVMPLMASRPKRLLVFGS